MEKILDAYRASVREATLPLSAFRLFADLEKAEIHESYRAELIAHAERFAAMEYPPLLASTYMIFSQNGNRTFFENIYYTRRYAAFHLFLGEMLEKKGRFLPKLVDLLWMILEESTWVIPAHSRSGEPLDNSFGDDVPYIDLFSAETGAVLAFIASLGSELLDTVTPILGARIRYELERRIFRPFQKHTDWWWMGENGRKLNNWTPWICSNVLTATAFCEESLEARQNIADRVLVLLDRFTKDYTEDGGCDEGPGYWSAAGATYFDCLEIFYDLTGGRVSLFEIPFVKSLEEYIAKVNICDDYYINFADAGTRNRFFYPFIVRYGRRVHSAFLENFARSHLKNEPIPSITWNVYRTFKTFCETPAEKAAAEIYPKQLFMRGVDVMIARESGDPHEGLFFAMKGGNNAENHNHNDLGNFIIYQNGRPWIIDIGVGTYTANTFNENRYRIFTMQSAYHNLPTLGGEMQKNGKEFSAKLIRYSEADRTLELELAGAYPEGSHLQSYRRCGTMRDGTIEISDTVRFSEPSDVEFHWISPECPTLASEGVICFPDGQRGVYPTSLVARIEEIKLDDPKILREWGQEILYRICFSSSGVREASYRFAFSAK